MEPTVSATTCEAIAHLTSSESLLNARLTELTGLNPAEMKALSGSWAGIETVRRRQIMHHLRDIAEDNLELNFDSVFKFALKDNDAEVRSLAVEGLWENEEASLIDPLIGLLKNDGSEQVQAAAAIALGKFALLAENKKLRSEYRDRIGRALLAVNSDNNRTIEVRRRALESSAPLSLPEVKQSIRRAYNSADAKLKASSIYAMGKSLDIDWMPELLDELVSPDPELRYEACGACGEIGEPSAVPDIIKLVNDPDSDVRLAAIQALGKIGTPQAKRCLQECLENDDDSVRESAAQALSEMEISEDPLIFRSHNEN